MNLPGEALVEPGLWSGPGLGGIEVRVLRTEGFFGQLSLNPGTHPLRDHPRFQDLLERYSDDVEH